MSDENVPLKVSKENDAFVKSLASQFDTDVNGAIEIIKDALRSKDKKVNLEEYDKLANIRSKIRDKLGNQNSFDKAIEMMLLRDFTQNRQNKDLFI